MKVLKRLLSRITLYPTVFLAGFICLLLATIFSELSPFLDRTDPRWRTRGLASDGKILSLGLEPGAAD